MKHGKFICNQLKQVRLDIARANGIKYVPRECHHEGDCEGTCPACESEMRYLEREIACKRSLGKAAIIAGVSLGLTSLTATSCDYVRETVKEISHHGHDRPLEGEVVAMNPEIDSLVAAAYTMHSDKRFLDEDYGMSRTLCVPRMWIQALSLSSRSILTVREFHRNPICLMLLIRPSALRL